MNYYNIKLDEVLKKLKTTDDGLSDKEVEKRLSMYGENVLEEQQTSSPLKVFFSQFNDSMIIILIIVAIIMFVYGLLYSHEYTDTVIIFVVVMINAIVGFIQEEKAQVTLDSLKKYTTSTTTVKRSGRLCLVDSSKLVVGDIIRLAAGDRVPADARIIKANNLYVDESALTGESTTVEKAEIVLKGKLQLQDQQNMIFASSSITSGEVEAVITATGMLTEIGKIAISLNTPYKVETPLEKKTKELSATITKLIFVILIFIFFYSLYMKNTILQTIMLCVSLAVAAIPEGLPAVITITLSQGAKVLFDKKTVVRQIQAVETLGSVDVICSDKTGTITQNKMKIEQSLIYDNNMINYIFALNNETLIDKDKMIGDPTEICLYTYIKEKGFDPIKLRKKYKRIISAPFDSVRKMSSSVNKIDKTTYILTKGSYENILKKSKYIIKNNKKVLLKESEIKNIVSACNSMEKDALRVMAYAYKETKKDLKTANEVLKEEKDFVLAGICGIFDPPRDTVKNSVKKCDEARIKTVMITGDSLNTACAIARNVGIIKNDSEGILGQELDNYSDEELKEIVNKYRVYARVSPIHKERIVKAFQAQGLVVAMTGDGVNDAPAIKDAHVGIGMGITGTEVTNSVADIVLLDDSFSTIVVAVEEGRRIFSNIRNNIVYSLSSNIAEIFIVLIGMIMGYNILLPIHILFIDLVTDSIPSIALSFEKAESGIMKNPPRGIDKPLFSPFILSCIISSAIIETAIALIIYFTSINFVTPQVAMTIVLFSIVVQENLYALVCRNLKKPIIVQGIFTNKAMNLGIIAVVLVELLFFVTPVGKIIDIEILEISHIIVLFLINLISFAMYEIIKPMLTKLFRD